MMGIISANLAKEISKQGWEKRKCKFFKEHENELKEIVEQCNLAIIEKAKEGEYKAEISIPGHLRPEYIIGYLENIFNGYVIGCSMIKTLAYYDIYIEWL